MFKLNRAIKGFLLAAGLSAVLVPAAFASDGTQLTISGTSLTITNPSVGDFSGATLDGTTQHPTASVDAFSVLDARGTGAGWHVTAQAAQFDSGTHQLDAGSLTMSQPSEAPNGTTSPDPTVNAGPYTLDGGSAATIATAASDAGMGQYDFGATTLTLTVPASAYAGTYSSTVTLTAVTGP